MKNNSTIQCPQCDHAFELSTIMRAELEAEIHATMSKEYENKLVTERTRVDEVIAESQRNAAAKEAELLKQKRVLADREQHLELELERRLADETAAIREREVNAAREKFEREANERVRVKDDELFEVQTKLAAATTRATDLLKKERAIAEKERTLEIDVEQRVAELAQRIREQEAQTAEKKYARVAEMQMQTKQAEVEALQTKLAEATARDASVMRKERALADREREIEVEKERAITEAIAKVRQQETKLSEERTTLQHEQQRLRDEEYRQKIGGLETTISELQRKVQQGSTQLQGEAQEVIVRNLLAQEFPVDLLEDVPNGVSGGDVVHRVRSASGAICGAIVWESKRTKNWSDAWLAKVRDDQRLAGAAVAVIVTQAMPADIRHFGVKDGVWICAPSYAVALGAALRAGLIDVAIAKRAAEGSGQKMQVLYGYLTGAEFRNHIEAVVEAFTTMRAELDKERRAMQSSWKRREKQLERALLGMTSLYGDLQGIAGRDVLDLPSLVMDSLAALPESSDGDVQS